MVNFTDDNCERNTPDGPEIFKPSDRDIHRVRIFLINLKLIFSCKNYRGR